MRAATTFATTFATVAMLSVACSPKDSPDTGSDPDIQGTVTPPKTYEPPSCGGTGDGFSNAACGACAEVACCAELESCAAGTPCAALLECRSVCHDSACVDACVASHPDGLAPATAYDACLAGPCAADCPQNPGVCGTTFSTGKPDCDGCVGESCCAELAACQGDGACAACLSGYAESCASDVFFTALTDCMAASCTGACDG